MSSITVRLAEYSDNDKIQALSRRCYQQGMITLFVNRTSRFNTLHGLLDGSAWHMVACKDDEIIGLVGVVHFNGVVLGKPMKIGYMLDLRVDEAYRSGLAAFKLVKTAVDYLQQTNVDMVIVNFLKNNQRPMVFTSGRGGLPAARFLGENKIFNLLSLFRVKLNNQFIIDSPTDDDIPALAEMYSNYGKQFKIAPDFSEQRLRDYITNIKGLSLENFLVARQNGEIKAMVACWDEHPYKSYQVLKLNPSITAVNTVLKVCSPFDILPGPIKINEPLKQLSLVYYAHNQCPEALQTLFGYVNNKYRGSKYTLITLYAQNNDPAFKAMHRFRGISVNSEMYAFARDISIFDQLDQDPRPVMIDITMIL